MPAFPESIPLSQGDIEAQIPQGQDEPHMPFWSAVGASVTNGLANQQMGARENYLATAFLQRDNDIQQRTGQRVVGPSDMVSLGGDPQAQPDPYQVMATGPDADAAYEQRVEELRTKYPAQMSGVETGDQVRARVSGQLNQFATRAGTASLQHPVGSFIGGAAASLDDPLNLLAGASGVGEAGPIAARMLTQSALWGSVAAVEAPGKAAEAHAVGGPAYGVPEALGDIGGALATGPLFELLHAAGGAALAPLLRRAGALLASPEADAERGAVNAMETSALVSKGVGPLRSGVDFDAGVQSLAAGAPPPPIEPARDLGDLFGPTSPPPGAARATASTFADAPAGANLYERTDYRGRPIFAGSFDPRQISTDAATFQFKDNSDAAGVTDRLKGVQAWDPTSSGKVITYAGEDGRLVIADGHQRLALASRLEAAGFEPQLDGFLFRAADGWTPQDVRVISALKNIRENSGTPLDGAKVLREAPYALSDDSLPVSGQFIQQARGLARLSPDAFGAIVNRVLPERYGAIIGQLAGDRPDLHAGLVRLLKAGDPANMDEAHALVQEGLQDEWIRQQGAQGDLFGESPAQSVAIGRAKLRAWLLGNLRSDSRLYGQLTKHADAIEAAGNLLARDANQASLATTNVALENISKLGMRAGELGDAMNEAARRIAAGGRVAEEGKGILIRVKSAIKNGERIDEGRAGLLDPAPPSKPAETAAEAFDEVAGKGQAEQAGGKPVGEAEAAAPAEEDATGGFHPSLFEDIPGAEREDLALAHLKTCAGG